MRKSGILTAISSLPNKYGIGTFGKSAYEFANFLKNAKQSYWQILPLGHTSYGDSPYQTFSSFAGNPYFIDYDLLKEDGLLMEEDYSWTESEEVRINYGRLYETRYAVLAVAYESFKAKGLLESSEYISFKKEKEAWLKDYAMFVSIKRKNNGQAWYEFEEGLKVRNPSSMNAYLDENKDDVEFYMFIQYEFFKQFSALKSHVNSLGIKLIGDLPIYVAYDSVEVWCNPELFQLDEDLKPTKVAGCPPDYFSSFGQYWGNPLYDWKKHHEEGYAWWLNRIGKSLELYDILRIDHFRGFEAYFAIPEGQIPATGKWEKGPGMKLFKLVNKKYGKDKIIAENLGFLTEGVAKLLADCGYPGMKVLEFGFDPNEDSDACPHNVTYNTVCYPGTHDNPTLKEWFETLSEAEVEFIMQYLNFYVRSDLPNRVLRASLATNAYLTIVPIQDYLALGKEARMNEPSTTGNNWRYQMDEIPSLDCCNYIAYLTHLYRRD